MPCLEVSFPDTQVASQLDHPAARTHFKCFVEHAPHAKCLHIR
jgi:hypothetical protein